MPLGTCRRMSGLPYSMHVLLPQGIHTLLQFILYTGCLLPLLGSLAQFMIQFFECSVQFGLLERLEQVIPYAETQCCLRVLELGIAAHHNKIYSREFLLGAFDQFQSGHARHTNIRNDNIWMEFLYLFQQFYAIARFTDYLCTGIGD